MGGRGNQLYSHISEVLESKVKKMKSILYDAEKRTVERAARRTVMLHDTGE